MSLHHQPRIPDMRQAAKRCSSEERAQREDRVSPVQEYRSAYSYFDDWDMLESPAASVESIASTIDSEDDGPTEQTPDYDIPEYTAQSPGPDAVIAATPSDFSELYPSHRVMLIRHDNLSQDGNMNLRIDTPFMHQGRQCDMTLFHLRLQDLRHRELSLRRYHRNSGREVCHSVRKDQKAAAEKRPAFHRSLSNALHNLRLKPEQVSSTSPSIASLKRNDSGYSSLRSVEMDQDDASVSTGLGSKAEEMSVPDSFRLEFSNYAQLEVRRTGGKGSRRYEFEYWGVAYIWKRVIRKTRDVKQAFFYLRKAGCDKDLAAIRPFDPTPAEMVGENDHGEWIPRCTLELLDQDIISSGKDVADAVVAAGLMALVDDSIRRRFRSQEPKQRLLPKLGFGMEYVGPRRFMNEVFSRKDSSSSQRSRPSSSGGPSTTGSIHSGRPPFSRQSSRDQR